MLVSEGVKMDKEELDRAIRQIEIDAIEQKRQNKKAEDNLADFINALQRAGHLLKIASKNKKAQADIAAMKEQFEDLIIKYQKLGRIHKKDLIINK